MKSLLGYADTWQAFADWSKVFAAAQDRKRIIELGERIVENLPQIQNEIRRARQLADAYPDSDGARALNEVLGRMDRSILLADDARSQLQRKLQGLNRRNSKCGDLSRKR